MSVQQLHIQAVARIAIGALRVSMIPRLADLVLEHMA